MCLLCTDAVDGDGKGTHQSVYLYMYLMRGPHNDELTWPLSENFETKLLNQICDNEHHSVMVDYQKTNDRDVT